MSSRVTTRPKENARKIVSPPHHIKGSPRGPGGFYYGIRIVPSVKQARLSSLSLRNSFGLERIKANVVPHLHRRGVSFAGPTAQTYALEVEGT